MEKSKAQRGRWELKAMQLAVRAVIVGGVSKKAAAKKFNVPRGTLQRHLKNVARGEGVQKKLGRHSILNAEQEDELVGRILDMESRLYGLSVEDVRKIVYTFCKRNNIPGFSDDEQMAGRKWMNSFMKRHPELSLRTPEKTSMQRAVGFNKTKVSRFFELLEKQLFNEDGSRKIPAQNMYNVDETGVTICQKPQKIVGKKGEKSIGVLTSVEKGKNITAICCVSASGTYVSPLFIYPRVRVRPEFLDRGPVGAVARANKSGWITEDLFSDWFEHFLNYVQPKHRQEPTLLLMDGHFSHTRNLAVIDRARENNVILLVFPSHCMHKLQTCNHSTLPYSRA